MRDSDRIRSWPCSRRRGVAPLTLAALLAIATAASAARETPTRPPFDAVFSVTNAPVSGGDVAFRVTLTALEPLATLHLRFFTRGVVVLPDTLDRDVAALAPGTPLVIDGVARIAEPGSGAVVLGVQTVGDGACGPGLGRSEEYALYVLDDGTSVRWGLGSEAELRVERLHDLVVAGALTADEAANILDETVLAAHPVAADEGSGVRSRARAAGGFRLDGTARWTDDASNVHPARGVLVKAFVRGLLFGLSEAGSATADADGRFTLTLPPGTLGDDGTDLVVRAYAVNLATTVRTPSAFVFFGRDVYFRERTLPGVTDGTTLTGELFTAGNADEAGRAFSIADALLVGNDYVGIVQGSRPASLPSTWPRAGSGTASFYDGSAINVHPSKPFAWDVLLHEYGHYIADLFDIDRSPGGSHACDEDLVGSHGKDGGTRLAWSEGLATYLGIAAQAVTGASALGVPRVGDTRYDSVDATSGMAWSYDIEARDGCNGVAEGSETNVTRALWDLADGVVDGDDEVALGHAGLWARLANSGAVTMSEAWNAILAGEQPRQIAVYGRAMAQNRIAPGQTAPEDGAPLGTAPPTFSWIKNGSNAFTVAFYDGDFARVAASPDLGDVSSWTPTADEWAAIRAAGAPLSWVIEGRNTDGPETGTYWSGDRNLGGADFAFVIDDTGSMSEEIGGVRDALLAFLARFDPTSTDITFQLTTFKDDVSVRPPTRDVETIRSQVSALFASGGGDCPEQSVGGLSLGTAAVRRGATVMLATDADPHPGSDLDGLISALRARGARVNVLLSGTCFGRAATRSEADAVRSASASQGVSLLPRGITFDGAIDAYSQIATATGGTFAYVPDVNSSETGRVTYANAASNILSASLGPQTVLAIPSALPAGATARLTLRGQNTRFNDSSTVTLGDDITVLGVQAIDALTLVVDLATNPAATPGFRDGTVTTVISDTLVETASGTGIVRITAAPSSPVLVSAVPAVAQQDTSATVEIDGLGTTFADGATTATFGSGISVDAVEAVSPTRLRAHITVAPDATIGFRTVSATTGAATAASAVTDFFRVESPRPEVASVVGVAPSSGRQGEQVDVEVTLADVPTIGDEAPVVTITGGGISVDEVRGCSDVVHARVTIAPDAPLTVRDVVVRVAGEDAVALNAFTVLPGGVHEITLAASADAVLRPGAANRNEGANPTLRLSGRSRIVVGFALGDVRPERVQHARLVLRVDPTLARRGWATGRAVEAHAVATPWVEGNGKRLDLPAASRTSGTGPGVTWRCAVDAHIENGRADCPAPWNGGQGVPEPSDTVVHTNATDGDVAWDVTADVQHGDSSWVLFVPEGLGRVGYVGRDTPGAGDAAGPRLILDVQ